jgi:prepilin signal peptidase PulO-like enzyme (type II secretory pathway)
MKVRRLARPRVWQEHRRESWIGVGTGLAGGATVLAVGREPAVAIGTALFLAAMAMATVVDLRERRIPNALNYVGILVALTVAAFVGGDKLGLAVAGTALGGGSMSLIYFLSRGRLGLGDVKLSAFAGSVLGPGPTLSFLVTGTGLGAAAAIVLLAAGRGRRTTFAYGPYLAAGAGLVALVYGPIAF